MKLLLRPAIALCLLLSGCVDEPGPVEPVAASRAGAAQALADPFEIDLLFVTPMRREVVESAHAMAARWAAILAPSDPWHAPVDTLKCWWDSEDSGSGWSGFNDIPYPGGVDDLVISVGVMGSRDWSFAAAGVGGSCMRRLQYVFWRGPKEYIESASLYSYVALDSAAVDLAIRGGWLDPLVAHEIGHAVGIGAAPQWDTWLQGTVDTASHVYDQRHTGPRTRLGWYASGGASLTVEPVPVEATASPGHWRDSAMPCELMISGWYCPARPGNKGLSSAASRRVRSRTKATT